METLLLAMLTLQVQTANLSLQSFPQPNVVYAAEVPETFDRMEVSALAGSPDLKTYAEKIANAHGLNVKRFLLTAERESHWQNIQSTIKVKTGPNGRENSWGIWQLNIDNPPFGKITKEQALDPYWATEYAAQAWDKGLARRWTEYRKMVD